MIDFEKSGAYKELLEYNMGNKTKFCKNLEFIENQTFNDTNWLF